MTGLLEGGFDLSALAACFVAIACLTLIAYIIGGVARILDFGVAGVHPLRGVSHALQNTIVAGCNTAVHALERTATHFLNGLIDSWGLLFAMFVLPYLGIRAALQYLWSHALKPLIHSITDTIADDATHALTRATRAERDIVHGIDRLEHELATGISAAIKDSERFATNIGKTLEHDFSKGIDTLDRRLEKELHELARGIEGNVGDALDKLRSAETQAIDSVDAAIGATAQDLRDLMNRVPWTDIAGLIAAVPLLRLMINTLEAETGLGNAECRARVRNICGADPGEWENLIGLLVGGLTLLSFHEMTNIARGVFDDLRAGAREYARMR